MIGLDIGGSGRHSEDMRKWLAGGAALLTLGGLAGYGLGRNAAEPVWLTGSAHVSSVARQATFGVDGWYYGFTGSVAWYDRQGSFHESGWPDCLADQTTMARFQAASEPIDLVGKPVLAVDCR